jgi:hypothetical protein
VINIPENIDVPVDVSKIARISQKMFDLLMRRTKKPYEAYAVLLILKKSFEEEMGFNEEGFKPLLDNFKRLDKD